MTLYTSEYIAYSMNQLWERGQAHEDMRHRVSAGICNNTSSQESRCTVPRSRWLCRLHPSINVCECTRCYHWSSERCTRECLPLNGEIACSERLHLNSMRLLDFSSFLSRRCRTNRSFQRPSVCRALWRVVTSPSRRLASQEQSSLWRRSTAMEEDVASHYLLLSRKRRRRCGLTHTFKSSSK